MPLKEVQLVKELKLEQLFIQALVQFRELFYLVSYKFVGKPVLNDFLPYRRNKLLE